MGVNIQNIFENILIFLTKNMNLPSIVCNLASFQPFSPYGRTSGLKPFPKIKGSSSQRQINCISDCAFQIVPRQAPGGNPATHIRPFTRQNKSFALYSLVNMLAAAGLRLKAHVKKAA